MDAPELLSIAEDWSYWTHDPAKSVPRTVRLPKQLRPGVALVIQGVRRCGKSTLLGQLLARYALDRADCLSVNFEDPRLAQHLQFETLQALVDAFEAQCDGRATTYFLDEIQHVEGWQRWLRVQLDRPANRRFVVTGSNAHLLSGELASSLTGRHLSVELFPYDYEEALRAKPGLAFADYLQAGGFPLPLTSEDRDLLLRSYFNDIVVRDVRERVGARSTDVLRGLAQMLFESAGSELSVRRVAAALGAAPDTTALYIEAIEDAYLAFSCPFFAWSERKRSLRNKKYYPIDTGMRRAVVSRTGDDRGKMLECGTYLQLRRMFRDVFYWRGKGEVDFVVTKDGAPIPIQVSLEDPTERHHKALDAFYEAHPQSLEAVFVDEASLAQGLPTLVPDA